ncbi:SEC14-like protein 4 [Orchesella cincta]|uniref:SEC14-like protein 4 n=1 Tax=Orchesella cincta TaxID=48709 RepID=A0A1D2N0P9_ORCCI|nr:SEC14-like protein 4 [Orchesella cincta]
MGSSKQFTPEESQKIQQLRSACSAILNTEQNEDHYLIRWLRARNMDVEKAEEMLRKSMKWRKDNEVDGILEREEVPIKYRRLFPTGDFGRDSEGDVVIFIPYGRYCHRLVIGVEGMETVLRWHIIWMETMNRLVTNAEKETGKKGLRLVQIVDFDQYSYKELTYSPGREFLIKTNKVADENYPELMKSMVIINAPKVFSLLFGVIKPFMSKETISKISIISGNEETWKKELNSKLNPENVPVRWGGTKKGTDEYCSQIPEVWLGTPVPLSYFTSDYKVHDFQTKKIAAGEKFEVEIPVDISKYPEGTTPNLVWKFKVENHDIGFSITCKALSIGNGDNKSESASSSLSSESVESTVNAESRVDSKEGIQEGNCTIYTSGLYTLLLTTDTAIHAPRQFITLSK